MPRPLERACRVRRPTINKFFSNEKLYFCIIRLKVDLRGQFEIVFVLTTTQHDIAANGAIAMAVGRTCALSVVVLVAVLASGAAAAPNCSALLSQGCTCAVPVEAGSPVGTLAVIAGDVRKSGAQQYTPLAVNTVVNLQPGDGILVGDRGEAELSAGGRCQARKLGPQSSLVVREVNGCACVAVVGRQQTDTTETGSIAVGVGGAVAAAAGAGGLFLLLDHPISP